MRKQNTCYLCGNLTYGKICRECYVKDKRHLAKYHNKKLRFKKG